MESFCRAFQENDVSAIEDFTAYLRETISICDRFVRKNRKENFYRGILLGLLGNMVDMEGPVECQVRSGL